MRSGRSGSITLVALAFALAASTSGLAFAEPSMKARLESDRLFRNGKRLYESGQYKEACEVLASSDALDPAIGTLGLLAACHEKRGDLVASWRAYLETAKRAEAKKDDRAEFATQQADALKLRLVHLTLRSAGDESGLEIRRDGELVPESQLGAELTINPGAHTIVATAPNHPEWRTSITLKEGERRVMEIPPLDPAARSGSGFSPPRWLAWAVGGVGAAGIGVGTITGVLAITNNNESLDKKVCDPAAKMCPQRDTAVTAATVSTIGFSVGVAGVAAGVALFLLSSPADAAPKESGARRAPSRLASIGIVPAVGPSSAGAVVVGVF